MTSDGSRGRNDKSCMPPWPSRGVLAVRGEHFKIISSRPMGRVLADITRAPRPKVLARLKLGVVQPARKGAVSCTPPSSDSTPTSKGRSSSHAESNSAGTAGLVHDLISLTPKSRTDPVLGRGAATAASSIMPRHRQTRRLIHQPVMAPVTVHSKSATSHLTNSHAMRAYDRGSTAEVRSCTGRGLGS